MTLSPAAQAVWNAFNDVSERVGVFEDYGDALAAAFRAAVDQVVPENANAVGDEHDDARHDQWMRIRYKLLDIANELEAL
jgi:hypothetical protein